MQPDSDSARALHDRINREMIDSFDEELEMEIDDDRSPNCSPSCQNIPNRRPWIAASISRSFFGCKANW